jgi:hypothetical protein
MDSALLVKRLSVVTQLTLNWVVVLLEFCGTLRAWSKTQRLSRLSSTSEVEHANIEAIQANLTSASMRINVSALHLIIHYRCCLILAPPFLPRN